MPMCRLKKASLVLNGEVGIMQNGLKTYYKSVKSL